MQPKKRSNPRATAAPRMAVKRQEPVRPVGIQALGTVRYEQLRRALHQLRETAER
ncbi:hypothetical protein JQX13_27615 [Archangium violaceum]|uniref:hypothetical protein n=1 Tax=Archangium violaceum TaxID=83451 RepID=UPI00193C788C|nr:hypothetical protein [Archangium violaceum]QRK04046.1 hypothetical protein JQX13_27615 [Archangium violaceum]